MTPLNFLIFAFGCAFVFAGLYVVSGDMAHGPPTSVQSMPVVPWVHKLGKTNSRLVLFFQIVMVTVASSLVLKASVLFLKDFPHWFEKFCQALTFVAAYCFVSYVFERFKFFQNSQLLRIVALLTAVTVTVLFDQYNNLVTGNLANLLLALLILPVFRKLTVPNFLVLGIGLAFYDAIAVFWSNQMILFIEYTKTLPGGSIVLPTSIDLVNSPSLTTMVGDVVLPAILLLIAYRQSKQLRIKSLWVFSFVGYIVGSLVVDYVVIYTQSPQPALISLMPAVIIAYFLAARYNKLSWSQISTL